MKSVFTKQLVIKHPLCKHFCPVQWSQPVACAVSYWSSGSHLWALCRQNEPFSHLTQCCSLSSQAPAAAQCVTASLARPCMLWPFATPLTSFLPQSFCSGYPGLFAVSQAASEHLNEDSHICSPQRLKPSLQNAPWRSPCPVIPSQAVSGLLSAMPSLATLTAISFHAQPLLLPDSAFPSYLNAIESESASLCSDFCILKWTQQGAGSPTILCRKDRALTSGNTLITRTDVHGILVEPIVHEPLPTVNVEEAALWIFSSRWYHRVESITHHVWS